MNKKTQKILTYSVVGLLLVFLSRATYKAIQRKRTGLTSDSKKAQQLNADMEIVLDKIKNAPK